MKNTILNLCVAVLVCCSCLDQIPIDIKESDNEYLIIDAELRDSESEHIINITINSDRSGDFQANFSVNDAEVYVLVDNLQRIDFSSIDEMGNYSASFLLERNKAYELYILYKGITYKSAVETLLEAIPAGDFRTALTEELRNNTAGNVVISTSVNLITDVQFPNDDPTFIRYRVDGIYEYREIGSQGNLNPKICYVQESVDFNNLALVKSDDALNGKVSNKLVLKKGADFKFSINYCMQIRQERISRNAYNFWSLVESEFSRTGDIFEAPPGIIRGNIAEQEESDISAIGLFSVIAVSKKELHILPTAAGNPAPQCQPFPPPPATCANCLGIPNSSLTKPECF